MTYSIQNIIEDGCFNYPEKLEDILKKLQVNKNLILQGPSGCGKTWLAKKLAYALVGQKNADKVRSIQFHPNLSYDDFIRKLVPAAAPMRGFSIKNGAFMNMIDAAIKNPSSNYILVIEEINRSDPSLVFGEMLTLLDADKRNPGEALMPTHMRRKSELVYIPANLYIIGTMNIAVHSDGSNDLTLQRRFTFIELEPEFNEIWQKWLEIHHNIDLKTSSIIRERMNKLNGYISTKHSSGSQFGHGFLTPLKGERIEDGQNWFFEVVEEKIIPVLDLYFGRKIREVNILVNSLNKNFDI